jgi:nitrate reductase gamma subunit
MSVSNLIDKVFVYAVMVAAVVGVVLLLVNKVVVDQTRFDSASLILLAFIFISVTNF